MPLCMVPLPLPLSPPRKKDPECHTTARSDSTGGLPEGGGATGDFLPSKPKPLSTAISKKLGKISTNKQDQEPTRAQGASGPSHLLKAVSALPRSGFPSTASGLNPSGGILWRTALERLGSAAKPTLILSKGLGCCLPEVQTSIGHASPPELWEAVSSLVNLKC